MNNQDMPVNSFEGGDNNGIQPTMGETKREKAFWMVYSAMVTSADAMLTYDQVGDAAIEAVNAGFKALESE